MRTGAVIVVLIVGLVAWLLWLDAEWSRFAAEHECRVVGRVSDTFAPGISSNGNVVSTFVPGKTGYLCNDGITYWR